MNQDELSLIITAVDKASGALASVRSSLTQTNKAIDDTAKSSAAAGKAMNKDLAEGAERAKQKLQETQEAAKQLDRSIVLLSTALTVGFVGAMAMSVKTAANFEHGIDAVGAISLATEQELQQLSETALRLGRDTIYSSVQVTKAMGAMAAGGISTKDIINGAADAVVALAAAGGVDLEIAAKAAAVAMDAWALKTTELTMVVNNIAGAANVSKFKVEDMVGAMAMGGGVAAAAGVEFEDFSATIAATASSFSSGRDAGTSFKQFLIQLANPTKEAKETMKALGIEFYNADGSFKSMAEVTQILHDSLGSLTEQQRTQAAATIFGSDALRTALGLAKMTGDEFAALSEKMTNTNAVDIAAQRMDNFKGDLEQLRGSVENVAIAIGLRLIPVLGKIAGAAENATDAFGALDPQTQNLLLALTAVSVAGPLVVTALSRVIAIMQALGAMSMATKLKLAAFAGPAGLGMAVIVADQLLGMATGKGIFERVFGSDEDMEKQARAAKNYGESLTQVQAMVREGATVEMAREVVMKRQLELFDQAFVGYNTYKTYLVDFLEREGEVVDMQLVSEAAWDKTGAAISQVTKNILALDPTYKELLIMTRDHPELLAMLTPALNEAAEAYRLAGGDATKLRNEINTIGPIFTENAYKIEEANGRVKLSAGSLVEHMSGTWGPVLKEVFDGVLESGGSIEALGVVFANTGMDAEQLEKYLKDNFAPGVSDAFAHLVEKAEESFENLQDAIQSVLPAMDETLAEWTKRLTQMALDNANFGANLQFIWDKLIEAGVAMPEHIIVALQQSGPGVTAHVAGMFDEGSEAAIEALGLIPAAATTTGGQIIDSLIGNTTGIDNAYYLSVVKPAQERMAEAEALAREKAILIGQETALGISTGLANFPTELDTNFVQPVVTAGVDAAAKASTAGTAVGTGFATGVSGSSETVRTAVTTLAGLIPQWMKDMLGIKSPSQVIADEVGYQVVAGLAKGIEDGEQVASDSTVLVVTQVVRTAVREIDVKMPEIADALTEGWNFVVDESGEAVWKLVDEVGNVLQTVTDVASEAMPEIETVLVEGWNLIVDSAGEPMWVLADEFGNVLQTMTDIAGDAVTNINDVLGNIGSGVDISSLIGGMQADGKGAAFGFTQQGNENTFEDAYGKVGLAFANAIAAGEKGASQGAALRNAVDKLIEDAIEAGVPNAEQLGVELIAALAAGINGDPSAVNAALALVADLNSKLKDALVEEAGITGADFSSAMAAAIARKDLLAKIGSAGMQLVDALNKAIVKGTPENVAAVAAQATSILASLEEHLYPSAAKALGDEFMAALNAAITGGGEEAITKLNEVLGDIAVATDSVDTGSGTTKKIPDAGTVDNPVPTGKFMQLAGNAYEYYQIGNKFVPRVPDTGTLLWGWKVPAFDVGDYKIPNDMVAQLHKGEAVIPAELNPFNSDGSMNGMMGNRQVVFNIYDSRDTESLVARIKRDLKREFT